MGADVSGALPPLPPGFALDQPRQGTPPLPPGFSLDRPEGERNGWLPSALVRGTGHLIGFPRDADDLLSVAQRWLGHGVEAVAGNIASRVGADNPLAGAGQAIEATHAAPRGGLVPSMATGQQVGQAIFNATGLPEEHAQTPTGRLAERAVEMGVASAIPGSTVLRTGVNATTGAVSGLAAQGVAEAGGGPVGQVVAALAVPGGIAALQALRGPVGAQVARAMGGLTPAQVDAAEALMREAQARGTPLTAFEAIQQVTGKNDVMQAAQRVLEQSSGGGPELRPIMSARERNNRAAFGAARQDAGLPSPARPELVPTQVATAADDIVGQATRMRSAAVRPLYQQAAADAGRPNVAPRVSQAVDRAATELDRIIQADQSGILANRLGPVRDALGGPGTPITDFESIDRARKYYRDQLTMPPTPDSPAIDKETAGRVTMVLNRLRADLDAAVPSYAAARGRYEHLTRTVIEPLSLGSVGRIADSADAATQRATLFPRSPEGAALPVDAGSVGRTVRLIASRDQQAARDLVSLQIGSAFDEAARRLSGGPNAAGGAKFAASVVGSPQQEAVLRAAIEALPGGQQAWRGFRRFLDVMEAQQFRPGANSATNQNALITAELSGSSLPGEIARGGLSLGGRFQQLWSEFQLGRNTESYARMITSPEGLARLRALANIDAGSPAAQTLIVGLLSGYRTGEAASR